MIKEKLMHAVFFIAACTSILAVALICLFLFANGIPAIQEIGVFKFLLGTRWKPGNNIFGILPMIMGSIYVTAGAIIIGVPIGIMASIFMAEYCPRKIYGFLKSATELLAGIPSVVYGFFGLTVLVPLIRKLPHSKGTSILTASILLGIMILPTIIGVTEAALRAVPRSYYEGSLALGATQERSIFRVMLPAAKSGVLAGVVLGIGRAIGEAMAIIMVAGNVANMPGLFTSVRFLTTGIISGMSDAAVGSLYQQALFSIGLVLFLFIMLINVLLNVCIKRKKED